MKEILKHSAEIFEILNKGKFICSNSSKDYIRKLYLLINEDYESYSHYFSGINLNLEVGDEYYYFSRSETRADLDRKLEAAMKWIDIVDFLKTYENSFTSGFRFRPADILVRTSIDADLKNKIEGLKRHTSGKEKHADIINKILEIMATDGFIEEENTINQEYKTLASFAYLEELVMTINISEEIQNEIPE